MYFDYESGVDWTQVGSSHSVSLMWLQSDGDLGWNSFLSHRLHHLYAWHPETRTDSSSDISPSLSVSLFSPPLSSLLSSPPSPHYGGFMVARLHAWWLNAPRAIVLKETGRSCMIFSKLALEVMHHHFCCILFMKEVTKPQLSSRDGGTDFEPFYWSDKKLWTCFQSTVSNHVKISYSLFNDCMIFDSINTQ